jgi:translation initiation factor IF-3
MKKTERIIANQEIRFLNVRVATDTGTSVMPINVAQQQAAAKGLDLVLINAKADPPVCRIVDLGKYRYEQQQKTKEAAKAQRAGQIDIKEVQFKPNIDNHDFETKCKKIAKFISKGNIVKLQVQFKGRERHHAKLGYDLIDRVIETVEGQFYVEGKPQFNGNRIIAILKGTSNGTKNTE